LNDGRLMLEDCGMMKSDVDPFPVNMMSFGEKKILVWTDQGEKMKGNMVVSDKLRRKMIKSRSPEVGAWNENIR
jgi:hypothetical protein